MKVCETIEPTMRDASIQRQESYDLLAAEYYDPARHPTCADLRAASRLTLEHFLASGRVERDTVIELGAGRSLVAEVFSQHGWAMDNLVLTDVSAAMLGHSVIWSGMGCKLITGAAAGLDLPDGSADIIVACLGDPYNDEALWCSVARLLKPGGLSFYTTPSFLWACQFRNLHQQDMHDRAEFLVSGKSIFLPSLILPVEGQIAMIEAAGLHVRTVEHLKIRDLPGGARSPKLVTPAGDALAFLTSFTAVKS